MYVHSRTIPGAFPQAELRPGRLGTHKQNYHRGAGWLAGWGAGWLAEAEKGPERPRDAQRGIEKRSVDRKNKPVVRLAGGSPQADLRPGRLPTSRFTARVPGPEQCRTVRNRMYRTVCREAQRSGAWIEQGCHTLGCLAAGLLG